MAIDASQIAAALAQDAAQLRGELESKTKQAVEMQKKRDAETAARKAQEQAAAAAHSSRQQPEGTDGQAVPSPLCGVASIHDRAQPAVQADQEPAQCEHASVDVPSHGSVRQKRQPSAP